MRCSCLIPVLLLVGAPSCVLDTSGLAPAGSSRSSEGVVDSGRPSKRQDAAQSGSGDVLRGEDVRRTTAHVPADDEEPDDSETSDSGTSTPGCHPEDEQHEICPELDAGDVPEDEGEMEEGDVGDADLVEDGEMPAEPDASVQDAEPDTFTFGGRLAPCNADSQLVAELVPRGDVAYCLWIEPGSFPGGSAADDACRARGGHAASVETLDEQNAVIRLATRMESEAAWMGLIGPKWSWLDGSHSGNRMWANAWPRDVGEFGECVLVMNDGAWQQAPCASESRVYPTFCKAGP